MTLPRVPAPTRASSASAAVPSYAHSGQTSVGPFVCFALQQRSLGSFVSLRCFAQPAEHSASCIHSAMHAIHRSHVQISFEGHMIPAADAPPHYQYGCAIYWAFTTFTTIGTAQCREGHLCVCIFTGTAG